MPTIGGDDQNRCEIRQAGCAIFAQFFPQKASAPVEKLFLPIIFNDLVIFWIKSDDTLKSLHCRPNRA